MAVALAPPTHPADRFVARPVNGADQVEVIVGKSRGWSIVGSLLLASALLAGCNRTSPNGTTYSAPSATSPSVSAAASPTSTTTGTTSSASVAPTNKTADVTWSAPTTNTDGSALTDLAGYQIYYGTSPGALTQSINVPNATAVDYVVQGLTQGTWYFAVAAYTNTGLQSNFSTVVSKTIT